MVAPVFGLAVTGASCTGGGVPHSSDLGSLYSNSYSHQLSVLQGLFPQARLQHCSCLILRPVIWVRGPV